MQNKIVLFVALLAVLSLNGCGTVGLVTDERSIGEQFSDSSIETSIKTNLMLEQPLDAMRNVNVYSFNGDVYLVGQLDQTLKDFAYNTAKETGGVNNVVTHWFPVGSANRVNDMRLETNIRTELLLENNVPSTQIDVDVWGGHVVLLGIVEKKQSIDRAINIVRKMTYVKSVTSYMKSLN